MFNFAYFRIESVEFKHVKVYIRDVNYLVIIENLRH